MKKIRLLLNIFLCLTILNLFSCRGAEQTAASVVPPSPLAAPGTPKPGDDTMGFRVWAESDPLTTYISHKGTGIITDDFAAKCEINTADVVKDISCVVEAEERDLYQQGAKINFNIPSAMCSYIRVYMPYYYNFLPGIGSSTATNNADGSASNGGVLPGETNETCAFDYTSVDGPNCCTGNYSLTTWSKQTSGPDISTVIPKKSWGGKATNCLLGPAMRLQEIGKSGLPRPGSRLVEGVGINASFSVPSPLSLKFDTNIFAANYFNPVDHVATAGSPLAYNIVAAYPNIKPVKNYIFECLDRAEEVKARIQMQIREWNLETEFLVGATGNPDSIGTEAGFGNPNNNDRYDLKDVPLTPLAFPSGYPEEVPL